VSAQPLSDERLRVIVAPEWYPSPERPGYGSFCREQARAVAEVHDPVVITWASDERLRLPVQVTDAVESGLRTLRIRFRHSSVAKVPTIEKLAGVLIALRRLQREGWSADVVHAHEYIADRPAALASALMRAPLVMSEHASALALGELSPEALGYARRAFKRASVVCAASHSLARSIVPLAGTTPVRVVSSPVDTGVFRPAEHREAAATRLLSVGNLVEVKGHRYLLDAVKTLLDRGETITLDIVGDGPLRAPLEQQAHDLGIAPSIGFSGRLERQDVAMKMREADVFVLPSLWETQGCVLLEAMASGIPSVATRVGGTPEVVDHTSGVLVEPQSSTALADGINEVIHAHGRYQRQAMHARALDRYGYAAIAEAWTEVYTFALGRVTREGHGSLV
jgi:glycosyltransferase involved in cell wall biosynthesis